MRGRDCYQVINTDCPSLFFIWWKETRFFFSPSHVAKWVSLSYYRDVLLWLIGHSGDCRRKASKGDHRLNTKQHLNFSLNWQALYYGSAIGSCGGRVGEALIVAELNMAGIYSGIKGARLIGFLFSEP